MSYELFWNSQQSRRFNFFFSTQIYTHTHTECSKLCFRNYHEKHEKSKQNFRTSFYFTQSITISNQMIFMYVTHRSVQEFFAQTLKIQIWRPTPTYNLWRVNLISIDFGGQETIFYWIHLKWLKVLKKLRSL